MDKYTLGTYGEVLTTAMDLTAQEYLNVALLAKNSGDVSCILYGGNQDFNWAQIRDSSVPLHKQ